jgi:hypothetical protein
MRFHLIALAVLAVVSVTGCDYYARPEDVDCEAEYSNDSVQRERCYYNKSQVTYNALMCRENINDAKLRSDCIDDVAVALGEFLPCQQHDRPSKRDACEAKVGDARRGRKR